MGSRLPEFPYTLKHVYYTHQPSEHGIATEALANKSTCRVGERVERVFKSSQLYTCTKRKNNVHWWIKINQPDLPYGCHFCWKKRPLELLGQPLAVFWGSSKDDDAFLLKMKVYLGWWKVARSQSEKITKAKLDKFRIRPSFKSRFCG